MQSQIIQRTPSIYFRFDDESHRNFSKSSFALDYSISNQKAILSNNRVNRLRKDRTELKQQQSPKRQQLSPFYEMKKHSNEEIKQRQKNEKQFKAFHRWQKFSSSLKKENKLKTEDFFEQFDKKYEFTFVQDDVRIHEWIPEASNQGGSGISRGFLNFEQFQVEQTMKLIQIESKKNLIKNESISLTQQINPSNLISFTQTNENLFSSQLASSNDHEQTQRKAKNQKNIVTNPSSIQQSETDKQNCMRNEETQFEEVISFGPAHNKSRAKKYKGPNSRHFITKDFQSNSSLFEKSKPILDPKRRVAFKNIENLIQKCSKDQRSQTRKKPIINTDLLVSTVNKIEKNQAKNTNGVWSNPINNKKSSSLECTFTYDSMFKTNAFRETLKSTTLQNWKKKYHKKIQHLGQKKTVSKKHRDVNIFQNLFIRA